MAKATNINDLFDRWSKHMHSVYDKFDSNKKLFPVGTLSNQDVFTRRQVRRFLKGLHKGVYPRGKAWERIKVNRG